MTLDWTQPVMSVLLALQEQGLVIKGINDGEGFHSIVKPDLAVQASVACDLITAVDMAWVDVESEAGKATVLLVLGNEPDELIADYSYSSTAVDIALTAASDTHCARWEGKPCPTLTESNTNS